MKKIVNFIVILTVILGITGNVYASTISQKEFKDNINSLSNDLVVIEAKDNTIVIKSGGQKVINYVWGIKPTFSIDLKFSKGMTKNNYDQQISRVTMLIQPLKAIAKSKGINDSQEVSSYWMKYALNYLSYQNYTDGIKLAKEFANKNINNSIFSLKFSEEMNTNEQYNLKATLTIDTNADFSVMKGLTDFKDTLNEGLNEAFDKQQESLEKYEEDKKKEEAMLQEALQQIEEQERKENIVSQNTNTNDEHKNNIVQNTTGKLQNETSTDMKDNYETEMSNTKEDNINFFRSKQFLIILLVIVIVILLILIFAVKGKKTKKQ